MPAESVAHRAESSAIEGGIVQKLKLLIAASMLALLSSLSLAESNAINLGAHLDGLLELARRANPAYASTRFEADAASERVYSAGALSDPTLRTELQNMGNQGRDASPNVLPSRIGSTRYTLIQPLPFWGKRDLRRAAAEAEADQAKGRSAASWSELAARIKTLYAQRYQALRSAALTREILSLLSHIEKISRVRYANGLTPQQDAIRAQLEQTAVYSELLTWETESHHWQARINALLRRPTHAPLAEPVAARRLPSAEQLDYTTLAEQLRARNPQLFSAAARIAAAEQGRALSERNRYPDFNIGISPLQTQNRIDEWTLMIELNLPLQQESRRAQAREAQATFAAAEASQAAIQNQLLGELAENLAALDLARRNADLIENRRLPQADLSYRAALVAYENGKVDFATLLDAQRQIRQARLDELKAQTEAQIRLAEVERLLGEDL
jgi:cobalt-zinc-cadmium efflux system outer membrane protein